MTTYDNMQQLVEQAQASAPPVTDIDAWAAEEAHTNAAKEAAKAKEFDPLDNEGVNKAAEVFSNSIPRIKALARNLKGGALYRVFSAAMEFPLNEKEPNFRSKAENELFILCLSATMAKSTMLQAMAAARAKEDAAAKAAEETLITPVTQDVLVTKEETVNE
jgi:hypothetical protein